MNAQRCKQMRHHRPKIYTTGQYQRPLLRALPCNLRTDWCILWCRVSRPWLRCLTTVARASFEADYGSLGSASIGKSRSLSPCISARTRCRNSTGEISTTEILDTTLKYLEEAVCGAIYYGYGCWVGYVNMVRPCPYNWPVFAVERPDSFRSFAPQKEQYSINIC